MEIMYCDRCGKIIEDDDKNIITGLKISFISSDDDESGEWIVSDYFDLCGDCSETYKKTREKLETIFNKKRCELDCQIRSIEANTFTNFLKRTKRKIDIRDSEE